MSGSASYVDSDDPYAAAGGDGRAAAQTKPTVQHMRMSVDETLAALDVPSLEQGLPAAAAVTRRRQYGENALKGDPPAPPWQKWLEQCREPMNLLLFGSAAVSMLVGQLDDAVCIVIALAIVITVGVVQEYRSEQSLQALNQLVPPTCHLVRDGCIRIELASELVPGDVVRFSTGDRVPADVRVARAATLEMDESALTGEVQPMRKTSAPVPHAADNASINERENIAYMGTLVQHGHGTGIVVATGSATEFGRIFSMVDQVGERQTPLQRSMADLAQRLSVGSLCVIGAILLLGIVQQQSWLAMFTMAVSLAVAAIPEGLPIVVTVTLALGALRMSERHAIVKRLPSVETLGCVSVVCSDKTGTLTSNEMRVIQCYTVDDGVVDLRHGRAHAPSRAMVRSLDVGALCNDARVDENGAFTGVPTETALMRVLPEFGRGDPRSAWTRTDEVPFRSEQKWMSVTGFARDGGVTGHAVGRGSAETLLKGSPEAVLRQCQQYCARDRAAAPLTDATRAAVRTTADALAGDGLRVLATAARATGDAAFTFCGLAAMHDPPRPGVAAAVATLQRGGVHVAMITGDAAPTAVAIARELGIAHTQEPYSMLTGTQMDALSDRQLQERVRSVAVFARTAPQHKLRIVAALQANNDVVGMTGDGVNDAPALKLADVGIAMGEGGTDVTKEAADVILVDDNFTTILAAVREGKSIFYNTQNFLAFQLSTSAAALVLITLSTAMRMRFPLNAMQILFVNILMDGPPSQSLGVDPADETVMRRPPRAREAPVLTRVIFARAAFSAVVIIVFTLAVFLTALHRLGPGPRESTLTFSCFVFLDLVSALENRGLRTRLSDNHMLLWTVGGGVLAQFLLIYFPPFQRIFQTTALSLGDLCLMAFISALSFAVHEVRRWYERTLYYDAASNAEQRA
ncbi:P-type Ca(2+) transporter [Malassezia sp. CBS 17886]|nr:P-type Ca(2+) transporter [Malassezia sp. CBS 17886]